MSSTTTRRKSNTFYVILIAGAAALGGFLFGFDTAVINGAVAALVESRGAIMLRPSHLDPDVPVSVHPAPDVLAFALLMCM